MSTKIRDIAKAIARIEESVGVEDPTLGHVQCYASPFLPPGVNSLDLPRWLNTYRLNNVVLAPNGYRVRNLTVFSQLLVARLPSSQSDIESEIASLLLDDALDKFAGSVQLDDGVQITLLNVRGEQERTLGVFDWGDIKYIAVDLAFDVRIDDVVVVGP